MDKILSQDEMNALFSAMSSEDLNTSDIGAENSAPAKKIANRDLPDCLSQD